MIYFSEAKEAGGCYPYLLVNKLDRYDALLVLMLLAWVLAVVGYVMMMLPQPLPPGCMYLKGQWMEVKHEWECQSCCACKNLIPAQDSYYNCVFRDCLAGGLPLNNEEQRITDEAEARGWYNEDGSDFEPIVKNSGDWCWDNAPDKRKAKNNCFERFAKDLDRSGQSPMVESNPEDDFPSCMGHCEFKAGRHFYTNNVTWRSIPPTTQEESRQPRCKIVCQDPTTPNKLMVDNLLEYVASGKTYVESLGPSYKFNSTMPMQVPPQISVDFMTAGISACILLIMMFTNCTSHRPRNFITKAALKKAEQEEERKRRKAKKKLRKARKAKSITPEGDETEDDISSDDSDDGDDDDVNPDIALADKPEEVQLKLIKHTSIKSPEKLTPAEEIKAKIAELKAKRDPVAQGKASSTDVVSFSVDAHHFSGDDGTGGMRIFPKSQKVTLMPITPSKDTGSGYTTRADRQKQTVDRSEMIGQPPPTGVSADHLQDDDLY